MRYIPKSLDKCPEANSLDILDPGVLLNIMVPVGGFFYLVPWGGIPSKISVRSTPRPEENNGLIQAAGINPGPQQNGPAPTMFPRQGERPINFFPSFRFIGQT